ncbi:MAG: hypothetical protein E7629_06810 [Ruminococcaceae bacterium]|nr:hypothetical protein [Oscillospiraceae bacterium]
MIKDVKAPKKTLSDSSVFSRDAYGYFGVHPLKNQEGYVFRVFAPSAEAVSVCGDFNGWDPRVTPMKEIGESGVWEAFVEQRLPDGCKYKYFLRRAEKECFKSDPFGICVEGNSNGASAVASLDYVWRDGGWLSYRKRCFSSDAAPKQAIHVYRVDPLWWKRHKDGTAYTPRELATELIPYVKQMGYTHVELLGVTGGLATKGISDAFFAPSPLFGAPKELMAFIDSMHEAGVGVILSWNPFCFADTEHGLSDFDGTPLFGEAREGKGVCFFDLERPAVRNFLTANALFWVSKYHVDGLSVAAERAQAFLAEWKDSVRERFPDVMTLSGERRGLRVTVMGSEFGDTWTEDCQRPLAWLLLDQYMHNERQLLTAKENHAFLSCSTGDGGKVLNMETN